MKENTATQPAPVIPAGFPSDTTKPVGTCPVCGGPMVNLTAYKGGASYQNMTRCWNWLADECEASR